MEGGIMDGGVPMMTGNLSFEECGGSEHLIDPWEIAPCVQSADQAVAMEQVVRPHSSEVTTKVSFVQGLESFFEHTSETTMPKIPIIASAQLDLHTMYHEVCRLGGFAAVVREKKWRRVAEQLRIPKACTNATFLLRSHYSKFLFHYELVNFWGENVSHHQSVQRMLEICPVKDDKEKDKHMHMQQLQQFPSIAMQHQNLLRQQQEAAAQIAAQQKAEEQEKVRRQKLLQQHQKAAFSIPGAPAPAFPSIMQTTAQMQQLWKMQHVPQKVQQKHKEKQPQPQQRQNLEEQRHYEQHQQEVLGQDQHEVQQYHSELYPQQQQQKQQQQYQDAYYMQHLPEDAEHILQQQVQHQPLPHDVTPPHEQTSPSQIMYSQGQQQHMQIDDQLLHQQMQQPVTDQISSQRSPLGMADPDKASTLAIVIPQPPPQKHHQSNIVEGSGVLDATMGLPMIPSRPKGVRIVPPPHQPQQMLVEAGRQEHPQSTSTGAGEKRSFSHMSKDQVPHQTMHEDRTRIQHWDGQRPLAQLWENERPFSHPYSQPKPKEIMHKRQSVPSSNFDYTSAFVPFAVDATPSPARMGALASVKKLNATFENLGVRIVKSLESQLPSDISFALSAISALLDKPSGEYEVSGVPGLVDGLCWFVLHFCSDASRQVQPGAGLLEPTRIWMGEHPKGAVFDGDLVASSAENAEIASSLLLAMCIREPFALVRKGDDDKQKPLLYLLKALQIGTPELKKNLLGVFEVTIEQETDLTPLQRIAHVLVIFLKQLGAQSGDLLEYCIHTVTQILVKPDMEPYFLTLKEEPPAPGSFRNSLTNALLVVDRLGVLHKSAQVRGAVLEVLYAISQQRSAVLKTIVCVDLPNVIPTLVFLASQKEAWEVRRQSAMILAGLMYDHVSGTCVTVNVQRVAPYERRLSEALMLGEVSKETSEQLAKLLAYITKVSKNSGTGNLEIPDALNAGRFGQGRDSSFSHPIANGVRCKSSYLSNNPCSPPYYTPPGPKTT